MRKGQAAIEFFMTYGWAILALLIVIGVLLTSGILAPTYLISEECSFGNNFQCNFALYNEGGSTQIKLEVFNGFPYKVEVKEIELMTRDGTQQFFGFNRNVSIDSGGSEIFEAELGGLEVPEGTIKRFQGTITYVSCAPELGTECSTSEHGVTGRVVGSVIPQ